MLAGSNEARSAGANEDNGEAGTFGNDKSSRLAAFFRLSPGGGYNRPFLVRAERGEGVARRELRKEPPDELDGDVGLLFEDLSASDVR